MHVAEVGKVCLITILDVVSRRHRSRVIPFSTRPILHWKPISCCSAKSLLATGLPRRISLDHGMVFYDNTSPSPFPTRLHLWLLADDASMSASHANAAPPTMPRLCAHTRP